MNKEQFNELQNYYPKDRLISIYDLKDRSDRTLIYGYFTSRETMHVYIYDKEIHAVSYMLDEKLQEVSVIENLDYVPSKRLYPERCDLEFCKLLRMHKVDMSFTTFNEEIEASKYYGRVKPWHGGNA